MTYKDTKGYEKARTTLDLASQAPKTHSPSLTPLSRHKTSQWDEKWVGFCSLTFQEDGGCKMSDPRS